MLQLTMATFACTFARHQTLKKADLQEQVPIVQVYLYCT